jgi:hypothetical protein
MIREIHASLTRVLELLIEGIEQGSIKIKNEERGGG